MNPKNLVLHLRLAALGALIAFTVGQSAVRAADHGDAPVPSNNQEVDIADVYFFLDPNNNDNAVLIATIRGFIAAGENGNFGIFDPAVRYHFELENSGDTKADKTIDVTFTPRTAATSFGSIATTPSSTAATAPPQVTVPLGNTGINFFAGMVDDPFFFDIPAFGAFITSVRNNAPNPAVFARGRDSFAGYNVMGIAFSIPVALLQGSKTVVGAAFYAQKQVGQAPNKKTGEIKGKGAFKTLDRMANPAVNVALVPFRRKNEYNQGTPKDDANGKFAGDIIATLQALGTQQAGIDTLAGVAVLKGDYLRLETNKAAAPNTGMNGGDGPNGFPNGRRLKDDVVDIELTIIANGATLGDNVNASDPLPQSTFPFLSPPNQPRPRGGTLPDPDTNVDDKTRN
jgi:hypothetical protein